MSTPKKKNIYGHDMVKLRIKLIGKKTFIVSGTIKTLKLHWNKKYTHIIYIYII